jgi:hypothetical protein
MIQILLVLLSLAVIAIFAILVMRGRAIRLKETPIAEPIKLVEEKRNFGYDVTMQNGTTIDSEIVGQILAYLIGAAATFLGLAVVCKQLYDYLKIGIWTSLNVIDGLSYVSNITWLRSPTDWLGLHDILSKTSLSVALIGLGIAILFFTTIFED